MKRLRRIPPALTIILKDRVKAVALARLLVPLALLFVNVPAQAQSMYRVAERFEVGANIFVRALALEPANGALWVGTSGGVHEVDLATYEVRNTFTRDHGLANEYVFAIHVDRAGAKWFGTNAGGFSRYKDGAWKTWFPKDGLADYWVYAFAEQDDGSLWIGTWDGVSYFEPVTGQLTTYMDELINEWVYGVSLDSKQRVWFATEGGVSMRDGKKWSQWSHADGLGAPNEQDAPPSKNTGLGTRTRHDLGILRGGVATYNPSYVFAIHADRNDQVWAGTWGGGVSRFDGKRWRNYTTRDGLAGNIVYSMAEDEQGALWFGTDKGLSRYDGRHWSTIGTKDGLIEPHVYAVVVTAEGNVWAGTRGGVVRIEASTRP